MAAVVLLYPRVAVQLVPPPTEVIFISSKPQVTTKFGETAGEKFALTVMAVAAAVMAPFNLVMRPDMRTGVVRGKVPQGIVRGPADEPSKITVPNFSAEAAVGKPFM
jgi:hypothetical protein